MLREIFTKGTGKNKIFRTMIFVILCYYVLMLGWTIISLEINMFIDFPCFVETSEDDCFVGRHYYEREKLETKNIEVYLTTYYTYAYGGGCSYNASDTNKVIIEDHLFQRDGENLKIDNKITLKKGEEWEDVKILSFLNPWRLTKEKISVKNHGVIICAKDIKTGKIASYSPTLIAIGSTGTYYEMNYVGILIFIILIGLLVYIYIFSKRTLKQKS